MSWVDVWEFLVFLCGLSIVTASVYTIRNPRKHLGRTLRMQNFHSETVRRRAPDSDRIRDTRRYGWFGLLMGVLFLVMTIPLSDDLRSLLAMIGLCIPLLYAVSTQPVRENVAAVVFLGTATGYGLLVVGIDRVSGDLLGILGGVVGLIGVVILLSGTPDWARRTGARHTFHYQCLRCERAFESNTVNMADARCPECGPTRVVTVAPER